MRLTYEILPVLSVFYEDHNKKWTLAKLYMELVSK